MFSAMVPCSRLSSWATRAISSFGDERDYPVQLLRVVVPASLGIYPEISGSHYRSSVRFVLWQGPEERPHQAQQDIPFEMICCG